MTQKHGETSHNMQGRKRDRARMCVFPMSLSWGMTPGWSRGLIWDKRILKL